MRRFIAVSIVVAGLGLQAPGAGPWSGERGALITVVLSQRIEPYQQTLSGFRRALAGVRPAPEYRLIDLDGAEAPGAALAAAGGTRADLLVAIGTRAARAVRSHEPGVPVVVASVTDPYSHGGGGAWVAGVSMEFPYSQQFQTLRSVAPRVRTVGTLYESGNRSLISLAEAAAREAGLKLVRVEVRSVDEIPAALESLIGRVDALWAIPDATVFSQETASYIILQTLRHRIPFMGFSQNFVKAGSLVSLYPDFEDIGYQAGVMAREVLGGKRPSAGGIVTPRKAMLAVNLRVADVIGLSIPAEVRRRANATYE
ncbi:MAG: ABC transporter substrate-binding protein [Acidobacteria bacterium]|nr:ABC transporter substrate-binding protein [Acidobacteriota bacterium]